MLLPGRNGSSDGYRYGFGGYEKDDEIKGEGNSYTTTYRKLDPRVGRWLSRDPREAKYPSMSPYLSLANNPILVRDFDGDTIKIAGTPRFKQQTLAQLQTLTNDKLAFSKDGTTIVIKELNSANAGAKFTYGTALIRELNKKGIGALPTVSIKSATFYKDSPLTEKALDDAAKRIKNAESGLVNLRLVESVANLTETATGQGGNLNADGSAGIGDGSTVFFNRYKTTRLNPKKVTKSSKRRAKRLGLAHELIHALMISKGLRDGNKTISNELGNLFEGIKGLTNEEIYTRFLENKILSEQKLSPNASSDVLSTSPRTEVEGLSEDQLSGPEPTINVNEKGKSDIKK